MTVRLRDLPLRTKLGITAIGAAMVLLGAASYLSFRYWKEEALQAAGQQALLGAASARAAVESAMVFGRPEQARGHLKRLQASGNVRRVRVYGADGTILFAPDAGEEGTRLVGVWLPSPTEIPDTGLVEATPDGEAVRAFLPVRTPHVAIIEVEFSVGPLKAAIDRGARLGMVLLIGALLAFVAILLDQILSALSDADGGDDRTHADDDAQHGQCRAHLIACQRPQCQPHRAHEIHC